MRAASNVTRHQTKSIPESTETESTIEIKSTSNSGLIKLKLVWFISVSVPDWLVCWCRNNSNAGGWICCCSCWRLIWIQTKLKTFSLFNSISIQQQQQSGQHGIQLTNYRINLTKLPMPAVSISWLVCCCLISRAKPEIKPNNQLMKQAWKLTLELSYTLSLYGLTVRQLKRNLSWVKTAWGRSASIYSNPSKHVIITVISYMEWEQDISMFDWFFIK